MTTAFYSHPFCKLHEMGSDHPEAPERLVAIEDHLISMRIADYLHPIEAPLATEQQLALVHTLDAINVIKNHTPTNADYYPIDGDTLLNSASWQAALAAAGAAIHATSAVIAGQAENAFCSIRPPGHHATPEQSMGFCLFNNVALAAKSALDNHGLERVAVIDFDVHHGNGTEQAFKNDPRVMMVSFFQHPCYPYSGINAPLPNMVNLPVPAYSDGAFIRSIVEHHWLPALHAFKPQMLFISAGFDAHREDAVGQLKLVEADYAWITKQLMTIAQQYAQKRIVSCLEGGYTPSALARSVAAHIRVLAAID